MKLIVNRINLADALNVATIVAGKHPRAGGAVLEAQKGRLRVWATDQSFDKWASVTVSAKVRVPGSTVVPAKEMRIITSIPTTDNIELETKGAELLVRHGEIEAAIKIRDAAKYPCRPVWPSSRRMRPCGALLIAAQRVVTCASTDNTRPVLTAICVNPSGRRTQVVGLDGFRMGVKEIDGVYPPLLIPAPFMKLALLLVDCTCVKLGVMEWGQQKWIVLKSNNMMLGCRLIEGTFPDYPQIIPKEGAWNILKFSTRALSRVLHHMRGIDVEGLGVVRLEAGGDKLRVSTTGESVKSLAVSIPAVGQCKTAFSHKLLLETVQKMRGDGTLETTTLSAPGVFRDSTNLLQVLMPVLEKQWGE